MHYHWGSNQTLQGSPIVWKLDAMECVLCQCGTNATNCLLSSPHTSMVSRGVCPVATGVSALGVFVMETPLPSFTSQAQPLQHGTLHKFCNSPLQHPLLFVFACNLVCRPGIQQVSQHCMDIQDKEEVWGKVIARQDPLLSCQSS